MVDDEVIINKSRWREEMRAADHLGAKPILNKFKLVRNSFNSFCICNGLIFVKLNVIDRTYILYMIYFILTFLL